VNDASREIALEVLNATRGGPAVLVATLISTPDPSSPPDSPSPLAGMGLRGEVSGSKLLLRADGSHLGALGGGALEAAVLTDGLEALNRFPRARVQTLYYHLDGTQVQRLEAAEAGAFEVMLEVVESPATLLIVGGGHIGFSLATIGAHAGFSIAVLDDRALFANAERFPMADHVMAGDLTAHLDAFPIDQTTYAVLVSRGHKQDETALRAVVRRNAAYVGMIGSRRRVATVLRHLAEEGYPIEALERVYTPVGFDIGAETPEEIAVAIIAEIIGVRRGGSGRHMREFRAHIVPGEVGVAE
jgi:xanthine dehydrogenase accessory factor